MNMKVEERSLNSFSPRFDLFYLLNCIFIWCSTVAASSSLCITVACYFLFIHTCSMLYFVVNIASSFVLLLCVIFIKFLLFLS